MREDEKDQQNSSSETFQRLIIFFTLQSPCFFPKNFYASHKRKFQMADLQMESILLVFSRFWC